MSIVYICPVPEKAVGGVKVIYQNCETLLSNGFDCQILHADDVNKQCEWLDYKVAFRRLALIDPVNDYVVIPEGSVSLDGKFCQEIGASYAIFVQNPYQVINNLNFRETELLETIYNGADRIISISENTTSLLCKMFKSIEAEKIIRNYPKFNSQLFNFDYRYNSYAKSIALMPRKLSHHAIILSQIIKTNVAGDWAVEFILNKSESQVAKILKNNSLFISLSDSEGFGLPPVEAALSGNLVVGYTGQGGEEYFVPPLFEKVEHGDFVDFTKKIKLSIKKIESGYLDSMEYNAAYADLAKKYSDDVHENALVAFGNHVNRVINNKKGG